MTLPPPIGRAATLALLRTLSDTQSETERDRLEAQVLTGNLRFCWTTARQYQGHGVELDDLFAEAQAALLHAIRRFDASRPAPQFSMYVSRCLRQALLRAIRRQGSPVAVPRTEFVTPGSVSLDGQASGVADQMLGESDDDPAGNAIARVDAAALCALVDSLPDREAVVVRLRFGLAGCAPHELAEIGTLIGVSKQRVQAILDKAMATLRAQLTKHKEAA